MRWLLVFAISGCSLYFEQGGDKPPAPDADVGDPSVIARPCIRAVAGNGAQVFLTYVCEAPGAGGIIEWLRFSGGRLLDGTPRADYQEPFVRAAIVASSQVLTVHQYSPGGWVFRGGGGSRYESRRPFTD